jgi:hypothetical protein
MPTHLAGLTLSGNPVASAQDYRLEPLIAIRTLSRLDKNVYEDDEKSEAKEVRASPVCRCVCLFLARSLSEGRPSAARTSRVCATATYVPVATPTLHYCPCSIQGVEVIEPTPEA